MIKKWWIATEDEDYGTLTGSTEEEAVAFLMDGKRIGLYRMDASLIEVLEELVADEDIVLID